MNKLISKIVGACLGLSLATGVGVGVAVGQSSFNMVNAVENTETYVLTGLSNQSVYSGEVKTYSYVEASIGSGSNDPKYYSNGDATRFYQNNTLTIGASDGYFVVQIALTSSNSTLNNFSTDIGEYSGGNWEGNSSEVVFSISAAARLTKIVVTTSSESGSGGDEGGGATDTTTYSLINNVSDLESGKSYLITNGTAGSVKTMAVTENANNRKTTSVTVANGKITRGSSALSVTLGGSSGTWTFKTDNYAGTAGYLASAASGSNNYLRVISTAATATISFSGNEAVIAIGPHSTRNKIMYNTSDLFACYSSGQQPVYLWKEVSSTTFDVTYNSNGGEGTLPSGQTGLITGATHTVAAIPSLTRYGYTLGNVWNTAADGSGIDYAPNSTLTIANADVVLYAKWTKVGVYTDVDSKITWDLSKASYDSASSESVVWDSPKINFTNSKGESSSNANAYLPDAQSETRIYKDQVATFTAKTGYEIVKIIAAASSNAYATALKNSSWTNANAYQNDSSVTIYAVDTTSSISATIGAAVGISSIAVQYQSSGATPDVDLYCEDIAIDVEGEDVVPSVLNAATLEAVAGCEFASDDTSVVTIVSGALHPVATGTATITASHATVSGVVYHSTTFVVTVTELTTIEELYDLPANSEVEINGYYAGSYSDGVVIMDGKFGVILFRVSPDSSWTVDETVLNVTGQTTVYKNLVEIQQGSNVTVQNNQGIINTLTKPENYSITGNETSSQIEVASRRSFVNGTLKSITAASGNYNIVVTQNSVDINLYLKAADNIEITLADSSKKKINSYLEDCVNEQVVIKVFTSFFNDFQARVYGIIEIDSSYTAAAFAQQLLDETDAVCASYDGITNNRTALVAVWNHLGGEERWQKLSTAQQTIFNGNSKTPNYANDSDDVVENAIGRYNYLCKKYSLSNFANRTDVNDAPVTPLLSSFVNQVIDSNSAAIPAIVVVIALATVTTGAYFFLRKKKEN